MKKKISVVKPSLPDIKDLVPYLEQLDSRILSNGGPQKLEDG